VLPPLPASPADTSVSSSSGLAQILTYGFSSGSTATIAELREIVRLSDESTKSAIAVKGQD